MPNFITCHTGCWDSLRTDFWTESPSNSSCNKARDVCKIKCMVIKSLPLGCVNNYDKNRYLDLLFRKQLYAEPRDAKQ